MVVEPNHITQPSRQKPGNINIPPGRSIFVERFFGSFDWREFACGCGAAFVNIGITYPIYKMIFRQILHDVPITSAFSQLRHEGLMFLYRGIFPPLAQKTISLSVMFGIFDGTRRYLVDDYDMNAYKAKIIAGIAAGTVETVLLPFERVQTLLAHSKYHEHFANTHLAFRYVLTHYGFKELYRGIVPVLWRNGPSNALFFILREEASERLPQRSSISTKAAQEFISGAIIGASISTLFYPLNVIKVAMQSDMGHAAESMTQSFLKIYRERGNSIAHFYRGCGFNTARSFSSISTKAAQEFISGAIIGASISTLFYPLNVIKVAMQSDMGHAAESMTQSFLKIYRERGNSIAHFYRGCGFNTARSFVSWGVMNAAYENMKKVITHNMYLEIETEN